jgi:hypothetical protein
MHNPKADIDRLYVKRKEGAAYKTEIINIVEHLNTSTKGTSL